MFIHRVSKKQAKLFLL